jgi:FHA domain
VTLGSIAVEEALLILKILFLVLLYLFIWRIVRSATRDLRLPQESFVLGPEAAAALRGDAPRTATARLVVERSPALREGSDLVLNSAPLTMGRGEANDVELRGDDFASAEHARFEPRRDGVWLTDVGSTNGTFVNGVRLERPRKLVAGDRIRIGATDLRFDT